MTKQQELIKADTVYGLMQSVNDVLRDRFASNGHTLSDNSWRECPIKNLEVGFWKAVRDRDFGSVLTYAAMLAGRGVNVANLIMESISTSTSSKAESIATRLITANDTIRLQRTTIEQHEKTIADLRAKLGGDAVSVPGPYQHLACGVALESERTSELCYSVEAVCDNTVETLTIQGDPAAVKDLVMIIRAEQTTCVGPSGGVNVTLGSLKAKEDPVIAGTAAAAVANIYGDKRKPLCFLSPTEEQSGVNRLQLATNLIMQLDIGHDGRATWLQSYAHHPDEAVSRAISNDPRRWNSIDEVVAFVNRTRAVEAHVAKNSAL